jgi:SNF2 family DNA or RNA helicase
VIITISHEDGFAVIRPKGFLGPCFADFRAAIEGAKWDAKRRLNYAPLDKLPAILAKLREKNFDAELTPEMAKRLKEHTAQMWVDLQSARERLVKIDEELATRGMTLYPFQRTGVQWLATRTGALLADEMGLGKTIQTICAIPAGAPVLIVGPAVAKGVWKREIRKARPHLTPVILEGRDSFRWPKPGEVVIVNYDILPEVHKLRAIVKRVKDPKTKKMVEKGVMVRVCDYTEDQHGRFREKDKKDKDCPGCLPFLKECEPGTVVIADEAHALKSSKAQRSQKFRALGKAARDNGGRTWVLTATPLLNRPPELWSIYQAAGIAQEAFGSWKGFTEVFNGTPGMWGGYDWGTPLAEAGERIRRVCLRRLRTEVLPELPTKTWRDVEVTIDKKTLKMCDDAVKKFKGGVDEILELIDKGTGLDFETLSKVRHALAVAKIPALLEMVEDYEEQETPVGVFSAHRAVVEELAKRPGWRVILGGTSSEERTEIEELFQAGKLKGIAGTIAAAGVAITLTYGHNVIFTDKEWTPALNAQAEDRFCRIGQDRGVIVTQLVAEHPLDERINELLLQKQRLIEGSVDAARVIDAPASVELSEEDIESMIRAAEEETKHAEVPKTSVEPPKPSKFRPPRNAQEEWAVAAVRTLAGLDPDRAGERNDVGFNGGDSGFGHSLAQTFLERGGLSDNQYKAAISLCKKYHRQVGECPEEEG